MSEIIFIDHFPKDNPTGPIRQSYVDLFHMVDLWGYKRCGYREVNYQSDNIYVVTFKDGTSDATFSSEEAKARKCKIVLWQIEWMEWKDGELHFPEWAGEKYNIMGEWMWADEIWMSDKHAIKLIEIFNPTQAHRFRYVFLGGHPDFGAQDYDGREKLWEAVHISYLTGFRGQKYEFLRAVNGNTFWGPNGWGEDRHKALLNARWGINLHQGEMPVITPQRFMIYASYSLPILTEYCANPSPYIVFQDAMNHFQPHKTAVGNKMLRDQAIAHNYELVTKRQTFKSEVDYAAERMVHDSRGLSQGFFEAIEGQWTPEQIETLKNRVAPPLNFIKAVYDEASNIRAQDIISISPDDQAMAKMHKERNA